MSKAKTIYFYIRYYLIR